MTHRNCQKYQLVFFVFIASVFQVIGGDKLKSDKPPEIAIYFDGNSAISDRKLKNLVSDILLHQSPNLLSLEMARNKISEHYAEQGYINSGAVVPEQDFDQGEVRFQIIEGRLENINLKSNQWYNSYFYKTQFDPELGGAFNILKMRDRMQLLKRQGTFETFKAEVNPGSTNGLANLDLTVQEKFPYHAGVSVRNDLPASSGENQVDLNFHSDSMFGFGDRLDIVFGVYRFDDNTSEALKFGNYSAQYTFLTPIQDFEISPFYRRSNGNINEEPFDELDISSQTESVGVRFEKALVNRPSGYYSVSLTPEHKKSATYLFDQPFSFTSGPQDGKSSVYALRLGQRLTLYGNKQVFSSVFTVSQGFNILDATDSSAYADGTFTSYLLQTQYLRNITPFGFQFAFNGIGQLSNNDLLPIEQISIGGAHTVRGYRENTYVRDNGFSTSFELRIPLIDNAEKQHLLSFVPFTDVGAGWNSSQVESMDYIWSVGFGFRFKITEHTDGSLFWGKGLANLPDEKPSLQDNGVHFRFNLWAF